MRVHEHEHEHEYEYEHERTNERFVTIFRVDITGNLFLFYFFSLPSRSLSRYRLTRVKIYVYWNDREYYLTGSHVTRPTEGGINSAKFTKIRKNKGKREVGNKEKKKIYKKEKNRREKKERQREKEVQGSLASPSCYSFERFLTYPLPISSRFIHMYIVGRCVIIALYPTV